MAIQLKMFEGVQGNRLGEKIAGEGITLNQGTLFVGSGNLNDTLDDSDSVANDIRLNDVVEVSRAVGDQPNPVDELLPPRVSSIQRDSQSHVSPDNPNPYEPTSHATIWAKFRAFFVRGFQDS